LVGVFEAAVYWRSGGARLWEGQKTGTDRALAVAFKEFRAELVETIGKQRERELREDRAESERFE
jgi:hypothetical protein